MTRLLLYFLLWIISLGLAIFSSQNIYPIAVKFISSESIKLPLGLVLIFCAGIGATSMTFLQTSISFTLPSIPKPTNSVTQTSFQNNQAEPRNVTSRAIPKNQSIKTKQKIKDDFDDEWSDEWS